MRVVLFLVTAACVLIYGGMLSAVLGWGLLVALGAGMTIGLVDLVFTGGKLINWRPEHAPSVPQGRPGMPTRGNPRH